MRAQIELDEYLETFQSYKHRYKNDYQSSYSDNQLYYSVDIGRGPRIPAVKHTCPSDQCRAAPVTLFVGSDRGVCCCESGHALV